MLLSSKKKLIQELRNQGIQDERVLAAMEKVDRRIFVPRHLKDLAYTNEPLPIGHDQTISQPYIVAFTTEKLCIQPTDRILEIGMGSGYQAAIFAELAKEVYTIEILDGIYEQGLDNLQNHGAKNIITKLGDGAMGWSEEASFNKISLAAATSRIPDSLLAQLTEGGILLMPLGSEHQSLVQITKTKTAFKKQNLIPVRFVPLTGVHSQFV